MDTTRVVLIVDDDPSVLETMRVLLEGRAGFRVLTALGARGALRRLLDLDRIDVVIADVDACEDNLGVGLCHEALRRHPAAALVAMSSDGPGEPPPPASAVALRKPFGGRELLAAIEQAVRAARVRHEGLGVG